MKFYQDFLRRLDIDRLHENVEALVDFVPKGDGKTTAILSLMLGEMWCGDLKNRYLFVGNDENHAKQACKQFAHIVTGEGPIVRFMYEDTLNVGQSFQFIGAERFLSGSFRGAEFARVFVDVCPISTERLDRCKLEAHLCERRWYTHYPPIEPGE